MCLVGGAAIGALDDLHPKVVQDHALNTSVVAAPMELADGGAYLSLKLLQGVLEIGQRSSFQLESRDRAGNRVDVDADHRCTKPPGLDDRGSAPDERIKDRQAS